MIYILGKSLEETGDYTVLETNTSSTFRLNTEQIKTLMLKCNMELKNAKIVNGFIKLNEWPKELTSSFIAGREIYDNVLLALLDTGEFKVSKYNGAISYLTTEKFSELLLRNEISNCHMVEKAEGKRLEILDYYTINNSLKFEAEIAKQYDKYIAKSKLLGMDTSFRYTIENNEVTLIQYTGTSKKVIIPSFIKSIGFNAFYRKGVTQVTLNDGLEYIGGQAFARNNMQDVKIPQSVRFIGKRAFHNTSIQIKNNKTFVMDIEFSRE